MCDTNFENSDNTTSGKVTKMALQDILHCRYKKNTGNIMYSNNKVHHRNLEISGSFTTSGKSPVKLYIGYLTFQVSITQ